MKSVFVFRRNAMKRVSAVRVFRCDAKKRAPDNVGVVNHAFNFGQGFMDIVRRGRTIDSLKERSVAKCKIGDHEVIFAWEVAIEGGLRDVGDSHDLLSAGRTYTLSIEEMVGSFHDPCPGIGLFLCVHEIYVDTGQTCLSTLVTPRHTCLSWCFA